MRDSERGKGRERYNHLVEHREVGRVDAELADLAVEPVGALERVAVGHRVALLLEEARVLDEPRLDVVVEEELRADEELLPKVPGRRRSEVRKGQMRPLCGGGGTATAGATPRGGVPCRVPCRVMPCRGAGRLYSDAADAPDHCRLAARDSGRALEAREREQPRIDRHVARRQQQLGAAQLRVVRAVGLPTRRAVGQPPPVWTDAARVASWARPDEPIMVASRGATEAAL